jgi:hypothetical protein
MCFANMFHGIARSDCGVREARMNERDPLDAVFLGKQRQYLLKLREELISTTCAITSRSRDVSIPKRSRSLVSSVSLSHQALSRAGPSWIASSRS